MTIAVQTAQNGDTATDTAVARISDTVAAGLSRTSPVAGHLVTLTIETWAVFVQSLVGMARDLFDGFAAEVKRSSGWRWTTTTRPACASATPLPTSEPSPSFASDLLDLTRD